MAHVHDRDPALAHAGCLLITAAFIPDIKEVGSTLLRHASRGICSDDGPSTALMYSDSSRPAMLRVIAIEYLLYI